MPARRSGVEGYTGRGLSPRWPLSRQIGNICAENRPPVQVTPAGIIRCHIPSEALVRHSSPARHNGQSEQMTSMS